LFKNPYYPESLSAQKLARVGPANPSLPTSLLIGLPDSAAEGRVIERTAETVVERRGPAVQSVLTKVKRRSPRRKKRAA